MFLISDLCAMLESYLDKEQVAEVYRAYLFGAEAHEGQRRKSGEPYIYHPLAVARILTEMRMDYRSIVAAILHDVIEDTPTAKEQLEAEFGTEVADLVDGVSKLTHIEFETKAEAQAANFRKMMLAMAEDIRVILIKLADRLHNMRTLGVMRPEKQRRIARETLEVYAPVANRLGINAMRQELEELGFQAHYPLRYRVLEMEVRKACGNRREVLSKILAALQERLQEEGLDSEVAGRQKRPYSIYRKMRNKHLAFHELMDVYGFRIVVDSVDSCYRALGVVHNLYKPVPGKFKDYIAIPKANGYQSLHTALLTPYGTPIEVQIRTEDMDKVAEAGVAAHWLYKDGRGGGSLADARARQWLRNLQEMQQSAGSSLEFFEDVKVDLFPDEVYVFTPKGEIMELPRGATAVDFAYAVHTGVGNSCVAVKIDKRLSPLHSELLNGQSVEVITSPGATPNPTWLNFVVTAKARSTIRHFLKNLRDDESAELGSRLLGKALEAMGTSLDELAEERIGQVLGEMGLETMQELTQQIGLGNRNAPLSARALVGEEEGVADGSAPRPLVIQGTEGTVVSFARCCRPIPGDEVIGHLSSGRGLVIHTRQCKNAVDVRKHPENWLDVNWEKGVEGEFPVEIRIDVSNRRGVLATVAAAVAESGANIDNVGIDERDGLHSSIALTLAVQDRAHLARIMRRLRTIDDVIRINRSKG